MIPKGSNKGTLSIGILEFPSVIEIVDRGFETGKCSAKGFAGEPFTELAYDLWGGGNCTLITVKYYGKLLDDGVSYSGAHGMIQRNELDSFFMPSPYPLKGDFKYTPPVLSDTTYIGSIYNISYATATQDIMTLFTAFDEQMWGAVISALSIFALVLYTGRFLLQRKRGILQVIWIVSMFMLDQDYLIEVDAFTHVMSSTLSFFCYFIIQWLTGNMSTDLIVQIDPEVIKSYDDILNREDTFLGSLADWPDFEDFALEDEGTIERKLWDVSNERARKLLNTSPLVDLNEIDYIRDMPFIFHAFGGKIAFAFRNMMKTTITTLASLAVIEMKAYDDMKGYVAVDPRAKELISAYAFSPNMSDEKYNFIFNKARRYCEAGLNMQLYERFRQGMGGLRPSILHKFSDTIQRPPRPDPPAVALQNVILVFVTLGFALLVAGLALLVEVYWGWRIKRKQKKKQRRVKNWKKAVQVVLEKNREGGRGKRASVLEHEEYIRITTHVLDSFPKTSVPLRENLIKKRWALLSKKMKEEQQDQSQETTDELFERIVNNPHLVERDARSDRIAYEKRIQQKVVTTFGPVLD